MLRSLLVRAVLVALVPVVAVRAQASPSPVSSTIVVLVRHAEKATEPANDPALSPAGVVRGEVLAAVLADARIDAVIVTPTTRTRSTAAPLALRASLAPEEMSPRGGVPAHAAAVAQRIRTGLAGRHVLVVGHGNTIPAIVHALGGPLMPDLCDAQYSNLYVIEITAAGQVSLVRSTYGAPDAVDAGSCVSTKK